MVGQTKRWLTSARTSRRSLTDMNTHCPRVDHAPRSLFREDTDERHAVSSRRVPPADRAQQAARSAGGTRRVPPARLLTELGSASRRGHRAGSTSTARASWIRAVLAGKVRTARRVRGRAAAAQTGSAVQRGVGELSKTRLSSLSDMFVDVRLAACSLARAEFAHMMGSMKTM